MLVMARGRHLALVLCASIAFVGAACRQQARTSVPLSPHPASAPATTAVPAVAPQVAVAPEVHEAAPESLFDSLLRELGATGPVAIVPASEGVTAVSLNDGHRRVLVPGPVRWVFVDDRSRVVWFQRDVDRFSELWALDLTQTAPEPERIVTQLPQGEALAVGYVGVAPETDDIVRSVVSEYDGLCEVWLHVTQPATKFVDGFYDHIFERVEKHRRAVAKATIEVGAAPRLQELAVRGRGRRLLVRAPAPAPQAKISAVAANGCEQPDLCGMAEAIPGTRLQRVLIKHGCGDACHVWWQLYDPDTREFIDFRTQRRSAKPIAIGQDSSLGEAYISRNGQGFVIDGDVFRTAGGQVFDGAGFGGGWLDGQSHVGH